MLFKVSAALVLTLLSITTSASPQKAAAVEHDAMPSAHHHGMSSPHQDMPSAHNQTMPSAHHQTMPSAHHQTMPSAHHQTMPSPQALAGPSGVTVTPMGNQNYTAGSGLFMQYQGFLRVSLETASIDVVLVTANKLNKLVLAQDLSAINASNFFAANFRLPVAYHVTHQEMGKPLLANLDIYEREKQFLPDGSVKFQVRYLSQAPFILINNAKYIEDKKVTS